MRVCCSCNTEVTNDYVEFKCPKCLKKTIVRCEHCRTTARSYKCEGCGFEGP